MPTFCIANERLADEKGVVLRRFAWKAARENDRDKNLHNIVRDRRYVKLRHVGFEMPRALVIFLNRAATASRPLVSTPRENQSMLGEFQSMDFTSSALCAFCAATNFAKKARAAASSAAAAAWPPDATIMRTTRRAASTGG